MGKYVNLRLSELYTSIQGEGPNVGRPTQFVRFAGCNLRCPGWPCDTPHAIEPSIWRHESEKLPAEQLLNRLAEWPRALTLTGGEPFMQPDGELEMFVEGALERGYFIDCFTNGTFRFPRWWQERCAATKRLQRIIDWKLQGSGETLPDEWEQNRLDNLVALTSLDSIKFTVASVDDLEEAHQWYKTILMRNTLPRVYVGVVWGKIADVEVVDYILNHELPWLLNVQVHKYVWDPEKKGV